MKAKDFWPILSLRALVSAHANYQAGGRTVGVFRFPSIGLKSNRQVSKFLLEGTLRLYI
jgi:hypothetical protein